MKPRKRILIMTCSHGSGHRMIAKTLKAEYEKQGMIVHVFDIFNEFSKPVNFFLEKLYLTSYGKGQKIYKDLYYSQERNIIKDFDHVEWYWKLMEETVTDIVNDFRPDLIVNTYSYRIVPILKKEHYPLTPVCSVITEYTTPVFWVHPDTDRYYVACEEGKKNLERFGTSPDRVVVSGLPVREPFRKPVEGNRYYFKYGLDEGKTTLILFAGTYGVLRDVEKLCSVIDHFKDLQTLVICGNNRKMRRRLEKLPLQHTKILGYVKDIQEVYAMADVMITKPGGTVLSEIVATKIPTILYHPVEGQELENAKIFEKEGAAVIAHTPDEVYYELSRFIAEPALEQNLQEALTRMDKGDASEIIVRDSLDFLAQREN